MSSRENILNRVKNNQPALAPLPDISFWENTHTKNESLIDTFKNVSMNVGSQVIEVKSLEEVRSYIEQTIAPGLRVVSSISDIHN